jgi:hypothetical protein
VVLRQNGVETIVSTALAWPTNALCSRLKLAIHPSVTKEPSSIARDTSRSRGSRGPAISRARDGTSLVDFSFPRWHVTSVAVVGAAATSRHVLIGAIIVSGVVIAIETIRGEIARLKLAILPSVTRFSGVSARDTSRSRGSRGPAISRARDGTRTVDFSFPRWHVTSVAVVGAAATSRHVLIGAIIVSGVVIAIETILGEIARLKLAIHPSERICTRSTTRRRTAWCPSFRATCYLSRGIRGEPFWLVTIFTAEFANFACRQVGFSTILYDALVI